LLRYLRTDTATIDVHRRVGRINGNIMPDCFFRDALLKRQALNGAERMEKERMMGEHELASAANGLVDNSFRHVGTQKHRRYFGVSVTNLKSRIVPFGLRGQGGRRFDNIDNIFKNQLLLSARTLSVLLERGYYTIE